MIRRQGEYYICEEDQPVQPPPPQQNNTGKQLTSVGDIKERLSLIKERVQILKEERRAAPPSSKISLSAAFQQTVPQLADYSVNLSIPSELLALQSRVQRLEERVSGNELQRQGVERGGTIVQRVKRLQRKLQEMIKNKSVEIINQNVNQYSSNLDEKEEHFKHLYLYDVFNRTQGLSAQIEVLEKYLTSLSKVQRTVNSLPPVSKLLNIHNNLLSKKEELQARIDKMFKFMKEQYLKLLAQIEAIEV